MIVSGVSAASLLLSQTLPNEIVYAESYPVQLSASQSLALFGQTIPARWYNGGSVSLVNFEFWKASGGITESIRAVFDTDPYISAYLSKNPFGIDMAEWSCELRTVNALPDWFTWGSTGKYPQKVDLAPQEFLIYRWQGQPNNVPSSGAGSADFQISIEQSIPLSNVERCRFAMGYSVGTCNDLTGDMLTSSSDVNSTYNLYAGGDLLNPVYTTSNAFRRSNTSLNRFSLTYFPMYNRLENTTGDTWELTSTWMNAAVTPCPQMALMFCDQTFSEPTTIDKQGAVIRAAKGIQCISNTFQESQTAEYTEPYVYLILMCPTLWGAVEPPEPPVTEPNYSDDLQNIQTGVNQIIVNTDDINDRLDIIIQKLDAIYEAMEDSGGGLNPTLSPAPTLTRYQINNIISRIQSNTPSASGINNALAGAALPEKALSDILAASGLSYLLPMLAALACAGWVLTKGRN